MSLLKPDDDWIHPIGKELSWREAFYFDFFDPRTRLSGFGYSGVHPNQGMGDVIFALWKEDILLAQFTRWDFNVPSDIGEERLGFGPLFFRPAKSFQVWEIFYDDGHCRLSLTFEAIHPAYFWADSHATLAQSNSHHYEQQGCYTGDVRVGESTYEVKGVGVRDHAWGWGARAGIQRWIWASAQFSPRLAFNTFQLTLGDGREILYGYLFRGHSNLFLRRSHLATRYAVRGKAPAGFQLEIEARSGEQLSASAHILNSFNISHQERNKKGYHFFCATEYRCEGQVGYGQSNFHWQKNSQQPADWTVTQKE